MNNRKDDHIQLAEHGQILASENDNRFLYEPMISKVIDKKQLETSFLGKNLKAPLWVSSMTGGGKESGEINRRIARACREVGIGMGLGSCRPLLKMKNKDLLKDFQVREFIGDDLPLYANLGIAQIEKLMIDGELNKISELVELLKCDGLIIHVNPLQEFFQKEGDSITKSAIEIISEFLSKMKISVIVKEVGQGIGPQSLKALMQLPLAAIEFGAFGGTNFSKIEALRLESNKNQNDLCFAGHTAEEMVGFINQILCEKDNSIRCRNFIISGGIRGFLDGHYLMEKLNSNAIFGQAYNIIKQVRNSEKELVDYFFNEIEGLRIAKSFLKIK